LNKYIDDGDKVVKLKYVRLFRNCGFGFMRYNDAKIAAIGTKRDRKFLVWRFI
jgi:hypothetical protein